MAKVFNISFEFILFIFNFYVINMQHCVSLWEKRIDLRDICIAVWLLL